jgi:hypothetical protein
LRLDNFLAGAERQRSRADAILGIEKRLLTERSRVLVGGFGGTFGSEPGEYGEVHVGIAGRDRFSQEVINR